MLRSTHSPPITLTFALPVPQFGVFSTRRANSFGAVWRVLCLAARATACKAQPRLVSGRQARPAHPARTSARAAIDRSPSAGRDAEQSADAGRYEHRQHAPHCDPRCTGGHWCASDACGGCTEGYQTQQRNSGHGDDDCACRYQEDRDDWHAGSNREARRRGTCSLKRPAASSAVRPSSSRACAAKAPFAVN